MCFLLSYGTDAWSLERNVTIGPGKEFSPFIQSTHATHLIQTGLVLDTIEHAIRHCTFQ